MRFLNAPEGLESDQVKVQDSFEEKLKAYNVFFFFFFLLYFLLNIAKVYIIRTCYWSLRQSLFLFLHILAMEPLH